MTKPMAVDAYRLHRPDADVLVLCYHAISPAWPSALAVTPDELEQQLLALRARGYVTTGFSEALQAPPARKVVAVTFDDAFDSVRTLAFPIIGKHQMTATLFVPTGLVDLPTPMSWPGVDHWLGTPHEDELRGMGWDGVAELDGAGWEIGSHTVTHPRLSQIPDGELRAQLTDSKAELEERLGKPCTSIAYPYGDHDDRVLDAAGKAGYLFGATLPDSRDRWPRVRPLGWPRVGIYPGNTLGRFTLETSPFLRRLRGSAALGPLKAAGSLRAKVRRR